MSKKPGQYKSRFSFIVEQMMAFASGSSLIRELKNLSPNVLSENLPVNQGTKFPW